MKYFNILAALASILFVTSLSFGQKENCGDVSDLRAWRVTILSNYQSAKPEEKKLAIDTGKKFIQKTSVCEINDQFADWLRQKMPDWEKSVSAPTSSPVATAPQTNYDAELAKKLGADERGMKMYVLCILKTGPNDANYKGKERDDIFAGHFANIGNLAEQGKLAVAGPFEKNDKSYRGLYIFNVPTIEEAEKLVILDPAVKAGVFVPELTLWYGSAAMMAINDIHKRITKPKTN